LTKLHSYIDGGQWQTLVLFHNVEYED